MSTKRISTEINLPLTILPPTAGEFDVDVPKTGAHFHLPPIEGETTYRFHLRHPGSVVKFTALQQANMGEHTLSAFLIHYAPGTQAETEVKSLGLGNATLKFNGMIQIKPDAKNSESYLNHHSLLFDQAKSWSWPALEIENNEVKCSHAATIKTITDLDLFYPMSRGIPKPDAREMLIEAFTADLTPHAQS